MILRAGMGRFLFLLGLLVGGALHATPATSSEDVALVLRHAVGAACEEGTQSPDAVARRLGGAVLVDEEVTRLGGGPGRRKQAFRLPSGDEVRLVTLFPGGYLRRVAADYFERLPDGGMRPVMNVMADGRCEIVGGRRIDYGPAGLRADLVDLAPDLLQALAREPLDAPPPPGRDPGGVTVAHVDSGINYTLPFLARRLARGPSGRMLGFDYWDMDAQPFDADTSRSPFFPLRHGTRVASILIREAPDVRLLPYRYPRPDLARMAELVADAEAKGARIVLLPMGSNKASDWRAFVRAARRRPDMLFVISAGNDDRNIDDRPIYPAASSLANALVVTSSDAFGRLGPGSNWGPRHVDLMVPAENVDVIDHLGRRSKASGSSFAVPRVAALAARLLEAHPEWSASALKRAIVARAKPSPYHRLPVVRYGWIPFPERDG